MGSYDYRGELLRRSRILLRGAGQTPTLIRRLRDLRLTLGDLKSAGETAGLSSVVLRIVFEPELMKSISSLSPRFSFTRPSPNEACSIQSCGFQFIVSLISVRPKHPCDRGGREGPNVAVNPCPPTKDYPPFHRSGPPLL